jgi:hypothetical protein
MFDWLNKLRAKPEPVRRAIAFWTSGFVVFVMVSVWLSGLPGRIETAARSVAVVAEESRAREMASPFASMKAELDELSEAVKGSFEYESNAGE